MRLSNRVVSKATMNAILNSKLKAPVTVLITYTLYLLSPLIVQVCEFRKTRGAPFINPNSMGSSIRFREHKRSRICA